MTPPGAETAILLSTWNGGRFIAPQLQSLLQQAGADWHLFWRDDGSQDGTAAEVRRFGAGLAAPRCTELLEPGGRLGVTPSFLLLLRTALATSPGTRWFAFADQDDVWLPDKLARGSAALAAAGARPALYCARQQLVDAELRRQGLSLPVRRAPGFPAALTQNIATGCTVMLNRAAAELIASSVPPPLTIHDWWCYLLISAADGAVLFDDQPTVLYRQHGGNAVGAPSWWGRPRDRRVAPRAVAFHGGVSRPHRRPARPVGVVVASQPAPGRDDRRALRGGVLRRAACLGMPGLRRQTWQETALFFWWFLRG